MNGLKCKKGLQYRRLLVDWLDDKLLVVEGDIFDLAPGKADLWGHSGEQKETDSMF